MTANFAMFDKDMVSLCMNDAGGTGEFLPKQSNQ